jgi:hypothetical protein
MTTNQDGRVGKTAGEYSVCQFFENDSYEYVRRYVSAQEAMEVFKFYTSNVTAKTGMTKRVIITDGGDCCNAEWIYGRGLVFPTAEMLKPDTTFESQIIERNEQVKKS